MGAFELWLSPVSTHHSTELSRSLAEPVRSGQARRSLFLSGEVEDHGSVFVAFAPGPGFRDVIGVFQLKDKMMLVAR